MEKCKVAYIGEPDIDINYFRAVTDISNLETTSLIPSAIITKAYISALISDFDVLVTGFYINSKLYNGLELIEKIKDYYPNFPCFVITDYYDEAIKSPIVNVHIIYSKSELIEPRGTVSLGDKIYIQAQKHKKLINKRIEKFNFLSAKIEKDWVTCSEEREWLNLYRWLINSGYEHMKLMEYKKDEIVTGRIIDLTKSNNILSNLIQSGNHKI